MATAPPPPELRALTPAQEQVVQAFMAQHLSNGTVAFPRWLPQTPEMSRLTATKFLIARSFDLDAAAEMLTGAQVYFSQTTYNDAFFPPFTPIRKYDLDALAAHFPTPHGAATPSWLAPFVSDALMSYQTAIHGWDRRGHPVVIEKLGRVDVVSLVETSKRHTRPGDSYTQCMLRWHLHSLCLAYQLSTYNHLRFAHEVGQPVSSLTIVWDTEGLSYGHLWKPALDILRAVVECDAKFFPELMHVVLVINCPAVVRFAYAIVRPWIDHNIQSKIRFLAPGEETRQALLTFIGEEHLPKEYGGLCECEGGCVPRPSGEARTATSDVPSTEEIQVPAGGDFARVVVVEKGVSVAWEYVSATGNDIAFGVRFSPSSGGEREIVPLVRQKQGAGQYAPQEGGLLNFRWDNKFSWMKGKTVTFRIIKT